MKKTFKNLVLVAIGISAFMTSCTEDALNLQPLDAISENDVFNDIPLLTAFVNAAYREMPNINDGNRMGLISLNDLTNDKYLAEGVGIYVENRVDALNGEDITKNKWQDTYAIMQDVNTYFAKMENSTLDPDDVSELTGAMHFLRAFYHFELLKYSGGVPIITERFEIDEESFDRSRNSIEEVISFIVSELDLAIPLLPEDAPAARASKAAAMAAKARVLLYAASDLFNPSGDMAKWEAAAAANKAVMDLDTHPMSDDYTSIFLDNPIDDEIIFTREYNIIVNQGEWSGSNTMLWPNGYQGWSMQSPSQKFIDMYEMANGELPYLEDGVTVNPASGYDPQNPYVGRDPRFEATIIYNGKQFKGREVEYWISYEDDGDGNPKNAAGDERVEVSGGLDTHLGPVYNWEPSRTGYAYVKLTDPSKPPTLSAQPPAEFTPDIEYRKTEFYLNYAETQIELGNEAAAREAINAVRARPSVNMPPITATGADLVEAYRRERAIELALEEHRFMDIRRWKIAGDVMGEPLWGVNIEKRSDGTLAYSYGTKIVEESRIRAWDDRLYWLPIPDREIQASNGALEQNPGY